METGRLITGIDYLRQSVWRILSTPLGTRVMRPEFGSRLPELVDYPFNPSTRLAMEAAVSDALARWEPTFDVQEVEVEMIDIGVVLITLVGEFNGHPTRLEDIRIGAIPLQDSLGTPSTIPTGDPSTPLDPSTPTTPTNSGLNTFLFSSDKTFVFGNNIFVWRV